jgi:dTDP-4-dehydrorhamnose 3,5-epimerase
MIDGVLVTPLRIIDTPGGDVMHAMKQSDPGYIGFGEAYFSQVAHGAIKAWKRHREMTLNLVVPVGEVRFVLYDDQEDRQIFQELVLSPSNFSRLTVPPMVWVGFQGLSSEGSVVLNIANLEHDPLEADKQEISQIDYNWEVV